MGRTCRLLGVQADSVVGDDGGGGRRHLELFSGELQHGSERGGLGHAQTGGGGGIAQKSCGAISLACTVYHSRTNIDFTFI